MRYGWTRRGCLLLALCACGGTAEGSSSDGAEAEEATDTTSTTGVGEDDTVGDATEATDSTETESTGDSGDEETTGTPGVEITPGIAIGPLELGANWATVLASIGEPDSSFAFGNLRKATYVDEGLELVLAGFPDGELGPESLVISIGANAGSGVDFTGPAVPGQSREEVLAQAGAPAESHADVDFYAAGWSVLYGATGTAQTVAVFAPFTLATDPPEMVAIDD